MGLSLSNSTPLLCSGAEGPLPAVAAPGLTSPGSAAAAAAGPEAVEGSTRPSTAGYPPSPLCGLPLGGSIALLRPGTSPGLRGDIQRPGSSVPRLRELDVEDPALVASLLHDAALRIGSEEQRTPPPPSALLDRRLQSRSRALSASGLRPARAHQGYTAPAR